MAKIIAARCFVVRNQAVLLVDSGGAYPMFLPPNGMYELPGGKIEQGETPKQAAIRELVEETGLRAEYLVLVCTYRYTAFFLATGISNLGEEKADLGADEILDVRWFPLQTVLQAYLDSDTRAVLSQEEVQKLLQSQS